MTQGPDMIEDDADDPAAAFDALRRAVETSGAHAAAEMTIIRKGLESALDKFEKFEQPADYSDDLSRIVQQLTEAVQRLDGIEKSPLLKNTPEHHASVIAETVTRVADSAGKRIESEAQGLTRVAGQLDGFIKSARTRGQQQQWVWGASAAGVVAGIVLTLFLPRILPGPIDAAIASTVMNDSRWNAGVDLMQSASPEGLRDFVQAHDLVRANKEALAPCIEAAAKAKKEQPCKITVPVPAQ